MLKKLLSQTILVIALSFSATNVHAALITQDIIVDDAGFTLGTLSIEIDNAALGTGLVSVTDFVSLNLLGVPSFDVFAFDAIVDTDNINAGIEFLSFDVQEVGFDLWNYQLVYDAFAPAVNFVDIFDDNGNPIFFSSEISLGGAQVVPEPTAIALMLAGLFALRLRRKV
jgi:hypothetical protein